jgi:hypothetical protein
MKKRHERGAVVAMSLSLHDPSSFQSPSMAGLGYGGNSIKDKSHRAVHEIGEVPDGSGSLECGKYSGACVFFSLCSGKKRMGIKVGAQHQLKVL